MADKKTLDRMVKAIHSVPQLNGMMVIYVTSGQSSVIHGGMTPMKNYARGYVVIEQILEKEPNALKNTQFHAGMKSGVAKGGPAPNIVTNRSMLTRELTGLGIQLVMTGVSIIGVAGGLALEVPSAGTSSVLVYASWVGLGSSLLQSANAVVRVGAILRNPEKNTLQEWDGDGENLYGYIMVGIDGLGIVAGFASWPAALKSVWPNIKQLARLRGIIITEEMFAQMNRVERGKFIRGMLEGAGKDPRSKTYLQTIAKHYGVAGGSLTRNGGVSVENASILAKAINTQARLRMADAFLGAASTPAGTIVSGMHSEQVGSASGSVRFAIDHAPKAMNYVVHILTPTNAPAPASGAHTPPAPGPKPGARFY